MAPPKTPKPKNDYTTDVKTRGLQAVLDRRNSRAYGNTNARAGLDQVLQSGQPARSHSAAYDDWLASQRPADYAPIYGRTDEGDYAGYKTASDLKAALTGIAEEERGRDRAFFGQLGSDAESMLDRATTDYTSQYDQIIGGRDADISKIIKDVDSMKAPAGSMSPNRWKRAFAPEEQVATATEWDRMAASYAGRATAELAGEDRTELNEWLGDTTDPYLAQAEFAEQGFNTPIQEYGLRAGAKVGVAPELVRGWYDDAGNIDDFRDQRDIESIDTYGLPYNEYASALSELEREYVARQTAEANAEEDYQAEYEQASADQLNSAIFQATGQDGAQLAETANVTPEQAYSIIADPAFQQYDSEIRTVLEMGGNPDDIAEAVEEVLTRAAMSSIEARNVLEAMYRDVI
jgi:hypothetical protein